MVEPYLALWFWRHPWVVSVSVGCNVGELCVLGLRGPGKLNAQDKPCCRALLACPFCVPSPRRKKKLLS